ncbi:MAG: hypothetical protein DSM106950_37030 [Stigonema ocellatum SAG 48.90 = DSM 106950]|nr:hypothetical protein [Stigonema ocellatum SAG 48.90 = DSM 106950]
MSLTNFRRNKAFISLGFLATLATSVAFAPSVHAQNDPVNAGCDKDGVVLTSTSGGKYGGIGPFGQREIKVYLIKSDRCKTNWVKADVPKDSHLYLHTVNPDKKYVEYTAQVNGENYTDMWDWSLPFQACAAIPGKQQPVCTSVIP